MYKSHSFNYDTVKLWNQDIDKNSLIVIPPVSLRDEIKTTGFAMSVIEILCLCGILIEHISPKVFKSWVLSPTYKERFFLCLWMVCRLIGLDILSKN